MNRAVNNAEFEAALKRQENQLIMEKAATNFKHIIEHDELYRCKLMALWDTLRTWRPNGRKFTSFLYQKVQWECLKFLQEIKEDKIPAIYGDILDEAPQYDIDDLLNILTPDLRDIVCKRYLESMTLREIGQIHGFCKETIRKKINKAIQILKSTHVH